MLPPKARDLILAGAIISILLNPLLFTCCSSARRGTVLPHRAGAAPDPTAGPRGKRPPPPHRSPDGPHGPDVIVGYGRVGSLLGAASRAAGRQLVVFDEAETIARRRDATAPKW